MNNQCMETKRETFLISYFKMQMLPPLFPICILKYFGILDSRYLEED